MSASARPKKQPTLSAADIERRREGARLGAHSAAMEGSPLDPDQLDLLDRFATGELSREELTRLNRLSYRERTKKYGG